MQLRRCKICNKRLPPKGKGVLKNVCRKCYDKKYQAEYYLKNWDKIVEKSKKQKRKQSYEYHKNYLNNNLERKKRLYISQQTHHKYGKAKVCLICGSQNKVQHHHFIPYNVNNFIDLCATCHKKYFHRKYHKQEIKQKLKEIK